MGVIFASVESTVSTELSLETSFSKTDTEAVEITTSFPLTVPPMSKVTMQAIVQQEQAKDVPFVIDVRLKRARFLFAIADTSPLYRYYNPKSDGHFYTTNPDELGLGGSDFYGEGLAGYVLSTQKPGSLPFHRYYHSDSGDHFYTTNFGELGGGRGGYVAEGLAGYIYPAQQPDTIPLYRYYKGDGNKHFFTTNWAELGGGRDGYVLEGVAGYIYPIIPPATTLQPLNRYYNKRTTGHFYTTNFGELGAGKDDYYMEGVAAYVHSSQASGTVPLHRYYNGVTEDHHYTTNFDELGGGNHGYRYEGVACYVHPHIDTKQDPAAGQQSYTVALHRYYNPEHGQHFFTTNWNELGDGRDGYVREGIAGWVYPLESAGKVLDITTLLSDADRSFEVQGNFEGMSWTRMTQVVTSQVPVTTQTCDVLASQVTPNMAQLYVMQTPPAELSSVPLLDPERSALIGLVGDPDVHVSKLALRFVGSDAAKELFDNVVSVFRKAASMPLRRLAGEALIRATKHANPAIQLQVVYDPPGRDLNSEHVVIRNAGTSELDLSGLRLEDAAHHSFDLSGVSIPPGGQRKVWTKVGTASGENLYWGRSVAVWNNTGDVATLRDKNGNPVAAFIYTP